MNDSISDLFTPALAGLFTDERVRAIEDGRDDGAAAWSELDALGFTDALVPAAMGGPGLPLPQACALLVAAGRHGVNPPFGETMVARSLLRRAGAAPDDAPIALGIAASASDDIVCRDVPGARIARHVLVEWRGEWLLLPVAEADLAPGTWRRHASATLRWPSPARAVARMPREGAGATEWCAVVHAAGMAGAMQRVLDLSVRYANDRRQFSRPIGQFQAVQQDLAVVAEQVASAGVAARIGWASADEPDALLAATAKLRACEAAQRVATLAHAVHGAIGITEEHMLGVFTARLHEARQAGPGERACAEMLGRALLRGEQGFADFMRGALAPALVAEA